MKESGAITMLVMLAMRLSACAEGKSEAVDLCERVTVSVETAEADIHSGVFYQIGTAADGTPVFETNGGFTLQFIEAGSVAENEYSTYEEPIIVEGEPGDETLDQEISPAVADETFSRRSLQTCGFWVIGQTGANDMAMYPMLKADDCAEDPASIDADSEWFYQECHGCPTDFEYGTVVITTETYECAELEPVSNKSTEKSQAEHDASGSDASDASDDGGVNNKVAMGVGIAAGVVVLAVVGVVILKRVTKTS